MIDVQDLDRMSRARESYRRRNNSVEIPTLECDLRVSDLRPDLDENDIDISINVIASHESASRSLVKEAMVLAGEISAKWGARRNLPLLYRYVWTLARTCSCLQEAFLRLAAVSEFLPASVGIAMFFYRSGANYRTALVYH
jgi:hypothetical protein